MGGGDWTGNRAVVMSKWLHDFMFNLVCVCVCIVCVKAVYFKLPMVKMFVSFSLVKSGISYQTPSLSAL